MARSNLGIGYLKGVMMLSELKASDWIAIFAGFIALLALVTTLWQSILTRRHNHLSARPVLDIDLHGRAAQIIGIHVKNCGPGPALLTSATATYRKIRYNLFKRTEFQSFLQRIAEDCLSHKRSSIVVLSEGSVIAPGQELELLHFTDTGNRDELARDFERAMHDIQVEIGYKCLYEKAYTATHDNPVLDFGARSS